MPVLFIFIGLVFLFIPSDVPRDVLLVKKIYIYIYSYHLYSYLLLEFLQIEQNDCLYRIFGYIYFFLIT